MSKFEIEFEKYPEQLNISYNEALSKMPDTLNEVQLRTWTESGLIIAGQSARSWEAAESFFKASPKVVRSIPFNYFVKWKECGSDLCDNSSAIANVYFNVSPLVVPKLRTRYIESWAALGNTLYKGTWKSGSLSCELFEKSQSLLDVLTFPELEHFVAFLELLSRRSYDLSTECLQIASEIFPMLDDQKIEFIDLASGLVESSWREVKSFFEITTRALSRIDSPNRMRFLKLSEGLVQDGRSNMPGVMLEMSNALSNIDREFHGDVLELCEELIVVHPESVPDLVSNLPYVLERANNIQMRRWFETGIEIMRDNIDGGSAYFKLESNRAEQALATVSSGVEFSRVKDVMQMYCRGLAGSEIQLAPTDELVEKNIGWVSLESPATEGSTVYLPSMVDMYATKDKNFAWLKVVSTHQVSHLEFNSLGFEFEREAEFFENMRSQVESRKTTSDESLDTTVEDISDDSDKSQWITDMQRFFNLFEDRKLALDVFTVVEDSRLDARVKSEYSGLSKDYVAVQLDSLASRPEIKDKPAQEALVEFLVRLSLHQFKDLPVPSKYIDQAKEISEISRRLLNVESSGEDTAEATLRIYAVISSIPNEEVEEDDWENMDTDEEDSLENYEDSDQMTQLMLDIAQGMQIGAEGESEGQDYEPVEDFGYRGDFKPELAQLMMQMRDQGEGGQSGGDQFSQDDLEDLLNQSAEIDSSEGDIENSAGQFANNLIKEASVNQQPSQEFGQGPLVHVDEDGGELESSEPESFVYDEWDFRADDYKPRWCIVRQQTLPEGEAEFYEQTVQGYGSLVTRIRQQFEMLVPELFRKVRRLEFGEEIDIDDLIEFMIDIKTGASPNDKFYWRRNKVQRDVASAFLLDTSASTAEAINDSRKTNDDWDAPEDPVEYMVWLRTRRTQSAKRTYKRIIDIEKEAVVLIINALEAIGDFYGIYGFSGYGRENVEFYTVKDLNETFNDRVKRRIDRIAPLHATRMGPAIRHAAYKLNQQEARTKLLFLISDGRPQDRGYSREGVEKEYAVHDTKMALNEAKLQGIDAFCLTVDKNGHDYLKTMCQDIGYEVLEDINDLPSRLLYLYKRLTM